MPQRSDAGIVRVGHGGPEISPRPTHASYIPPPLCFDSCVPANGSVRYVPPVVQQNHNHGYTICKETVQKELDRLRTIAVAIWLSPVVKPQYLYEPPEARKPVRPDEQMIAAHRSKLRKQEEVVVQ